MILVTGASGKTGRAIVAALAKRGERVRAVIHHGGQPIPGDNVEGVVADMLNGDAMHAAMHGVRAVYHICPNVHPQEVAICAIAIDAAKAAGVRRFVFHSVLRPQTEKMPHHWRKLRAEELLQESGLNFTILQPTAYMQNILASREHILREGVYAVPYPPATAISLVDLADVAEVAVRMLTEPNHDYAIYELCGTPPLSQSAVATALTEAVGHPVRAQETPLAIWRAAAAQTLDAARIETLTHMFAFYAAFGLRGNPNVLAWLLGRSPTSLAEFCIREMGVGHG